MSRLGDGGPKAGLEKTVAVLRAKSAGAGWSPWDAGFTVGGRKCKKREGGGCMTVASTVSNGET